MPSNPFPPIRRILTGHDGDGRSIISGDESFGLEAVAPGADMALIWTTLGFPVDNGDPTEGRDRQTGLTLKNGSVVRIVDFMPGSQSPMHRTFSIDFGIVIAGEIELEMEDGSKIIAGPHSIIVQRGTNHQWRNTSAEHAARVAFVLIDAQPYVHAGQALAEVGF